MLDIAGRRPNVLFLAVAGYFLLSIVLRLAVSSSLEIDEADQAFQSQVLRLGYGPQPPFYNWLQYGLSQLFGMSLATMTILKNGLLFLCCLFYALAARIVLADRRLPALAMLGILSLPTIFLLAQRDLSHTVAAIFAVSLFLYGFLKTLTRPSLWSYLLTGVAVGIGLISKYNFAVIPLAAILAVLPERDLRARIFDWRILAAIAVAVAIVLPHGIWVLQNLGAASSNTLREMQEREAEGRLLQTFHGVSALVSATIGGSVVTLLLFGLAFREKIRLIWQAESRWTRIVGRMLALCLLAVLLIVLGVAATHVREKWLVLYLILLPLYLCLKIDAAKIDAAPGYRRFAPLVASIVVATLLIVSARAVVRPWLGDYSRLNIPYAAFVEAVTKAEGQPPALVLAGDKRIAGNLRTRLNGTSAIIPRLSDGLLADPAKRPLLVVWHDDKGPTPQIPSAIKNALESAGIAATEMTPRHLALPYIHGSDADLHGFGYMWIAE